MSDSKWLEAYKLFRQEGQKSIDLHATYFKNFLTLLVAIAAATLAGAQYCIDKHSYVWLVLIVGGCFGIITAYLGKELCDRFYEGMLEAVTVTAKLEEIVGLVSRAENDKAKTHSKIFPTDDNLIPQRWVDNRKHYQSSSCFIAAHMKLGSNKVIRLVFKIFIFAYSLVLAGGFLVSLVAIIAG